MESPEHVSNLIPVAPQIEREAEAEADLVPGTEIMTAIVGERFDNQDSIILIPQPSNDPHDPLVSFTHCLPFVCYFFLYTSLALIPLGL